MEIYDFPEQPSEIYSYSKLFHTTTEGPRLDPPEEWDWRRKHPLSRMMDTTLRFSLMKDTVSEEVRDVDFHIQCSQSHFLSPILCLFDRWAIWNKAMPPTPYVEYLFQVYPQLYDALKNGTLRPFETWSILEKHGALVHSLDLSQDPYAKDANEINRFVGDNISQNYILSRRLLDDETSWKTNHILPTTYMSKKQQRGIGARRIYKLCPSERNIRAEIYNHGPVTCTFRATTYFKMFWKHLLDGNTNSIYTEISSSTMSHDNISSTALSQQYVTGEEEVTCRILGWGKERDVYFWICTFVDTSVTQYAQEQSLYNYGFNGCFRMSRTCNLLIHVYAGLPFLTDLENPKQQPEECCPQIFPHHVCSIRYMELTSKFIKHTKMRLFKGPKKPLKKLKKGSSTKEKNQIVLTHDSNHNELSMNENIDKNTNIPDPIKVMEQLFGSTKTWFDSMLSNEITSIILLYSCIGVAVLILILGIVLHFLNKK